MNNLIISFNVIMPLFMSIMLGYFIKGVGIIDEQTIKVMNSVTFKVFFPILLFSNTYNINLEGIFNVKLISFSVIAVLITCISMYIAIPKIEDNNKKCGVLIQNIFRSNFILFALPITISLFGEKNSGIAALLIAIVIPLFNFLAVVILEIFRGKNIDIKKIVKGIVTNPLILGCFAGMLFMMLGIKLPYVVEKTIVDTSKITTPLALIILGASFKFGN